MATNNKTQGKSQSTEHISWANMKQRCLNPNSFGYKCYGGRGVTICDRWLDSFENFIEDMGKKPSKKHSLDRIDNDGNYEPGNCKWATRKEQAYNRRTNRYITCNGITKTLFQWAEYTGFNYDSIAYRLNAGWDVNRALFEPIRKRTKESKMKKFKLTRAIQFNETLEIEAEDWEAAKRILESDAEFEGPKDIMVIDELIDYQGEV